jgi:two-component system, NtrC family, sensor kinase
MDGKVYGTIRVSDTGEGIEAENFNRIFEPFFTTRISPLRIGLGLSIARKIMEDHQGRIEVESTAGAGTTVTLLFPSAEK